MKKLVATLLIILLFLSFGTVFAVEERNIMETNTASQIIEESEKVNDEMDEYTRKYGSPEYGTTAFILNKVRLYSIPFAFLGIAISAIYQYVIGIRQLEARDKGFNSMIAIVTLFVICQVLPLVFAIVVKDWSE